MKRLHSLLLTLSAIGLLVSTARAELVGYWPFEDGEESEIASDLSGNENHGILMGDATFTDDGRIGSALDLGEFNNNAYLSLTDAALGEDGAAGFNSLVESQNVTISYWLNRGGDPAANQWTFWFGPDRQLGSHAPWGNGQVYFDVAGCCATNQRINTSMQGADTDAEWHHLVYRKEKPEGEALAQTSIWLDGNLLIESGGFVIDDISDITEATIGANAGGGNSHNGLIDEFAIWDEALPVDLIQALAEGASVLPARELPGDFNLDGVVDMVDYGIMTANFGGRFDFEVAADMGDVNGDLRVNLKDFVAFREAFNGAAGAAAAVPEPGGLALTFVGLFALAGLRRRQR